MDFVFHTLRFQLSGNNLYLNVLDNKNKLDVLLSGIIGQSFNPLVHPKYEMRKDELFIDWPSIGHLSITHFELKPQHHKYKFEYISFSPKKLLDMFDMKKAHWYGGAQIMKMTWPMERWNMPLAPYVADDSFKEGKYGGVQERYFFSSNGVSIFVDYKVPLFLAINENHNNQLTFMSKFEDPYQNHLNKQPFLNYYLYHAPGIREVHDITCEEWIKKPIKHPEHSIFRTPIWSTWAIYKKNISEKIVKEYAEKILSKGFGPSQIEIDDDWTPHYGDHSFDKSKFPDPKSLVKWLKDKNFRVTLWVHPFASSISDASVHDYWVSSYKGGLTTWWNGIGKCLDVTNQDACYWFKNCLQHLMKEVGVDSYKFDAGEVNWLPSSFTTRKMMETPNEYPHRYAKLCYSVEDERCIQEVRVGVGTQKLPILVRMMDKQSEWGFNNGLQTLIPHALTFGLIGYPFVLPDMVGGNAYNGMPDKELYIRWMEANALMPFIQISIPPWQYDQEVVEISKKMIQLHEKYGDLFVHLAKEATQTGYPIMRPIWWLDPKDEMALLSDSEFLVGNDLLVAPVLTAKTEVRSIYLPSGKWKCMLHGNIYEGKKWLDNFRVKLDELPYFERVK